MSAQLLVVTLALLTCSTSVGTVAQPRKPVTHTVVIEAMQFKPATLTIRPGDSVVWVNKDIVEHTATTTASGKQPFDSRIIPQGKSWKRSFKAVGTHDYLCTYHPTMTGVIKVSAAGPRSRSPRR